MEFCSSDPKKYIINRKHLIKILSLIVIFTFTWQQVSWAQGGASPVIPQTGVSIPYDSGKVEQKYINGSDELIINIQDAHASLSAQESIADLLDSLVTNYDLSLVAVEGSGGYIDTSILRTIPDKESRKDTAHYLMKKGKMSAGEFFAVTSEEDIALYGVEDDELYRENVAFFRKTIEKRNECLAQIEILENALTEAGKETYSENLREFNRATSGHREGTLGFLKYWEAVSKFAEENSIDHAIYGNIAKLLASLELESRINFKKANTERKNLVDELSKILVKAELEALVLKSLAFKKGDISQVEFHEYLVLMAEGKNIDLTPYENLVNFTRYISIYDSVDILALYSEVEGLEKAIREKLFRNSEERELFSLQEKAVILKKVFNVTLSSSDVDYILENRSEFSEKAFRSGLVSFNQVDLPLIFGGMDEAINFYNLAQKRDETMLRNTIKRMKEENKKVAALITGGFHTKGLADLMKSKGLSYLVVMPKYEENEERPYIAILTGKTKGYRELIEKGEYELAVHQYLSTGKIDDLRDCLVYELRKATTNREIESKKRIWISNYRRAYETFPQEKKNALAAPRITPEEFEETLARVTPEVLQELRGIEDLCLEKDIIAAAIEKVERKREKEEARRKSDKKSTREIRLEEVKAELEAINEQIGKYSIKESERKTRDRIIKRIADGKPVYLTPSEEPKVWGVDGIGEYWYGAEKGEKSSMVELGEDVARMDEILVRAPELVLGKDVVSKFGQNLPLVKILTPKGRLSVQFHDSKNELWIVTGVDGSVAGGKPEIILGFSKDEIENPAGKVNERYREALEYYGKTLNTLIDLMIEKGHEDRLKGKRNVVTAAEGIEDAEIVVAIAEVISAREHLDGFYNRVSVKVGDVIPIPAGTLHALGAGVEVVEPQIPGPTQSLEDGATYPVRYYFPGYKRKGSKKELDIGRADEIDPNAVKKEDPVVIKETDSVKVEQLPGGFEDKGLGVNRITMSAGVKLEVRDITSFHNLVLVSGRGAKVVIKGKEYEIPKATPRGRMLLIPARAGNFTIIAEEDIQIIDTFTPTQYRGPPKGSDIPKGASGRSRLSGAAGWLLPIAIGAGAATSIECVEDNNGNEGWTDPTTGITYWYWDNGSIRRIQYPSGHYQTDAEGYRYWAIDYYRGPDDGQGLPENVQYLGRDPETGVEDGTENGPVYHFENDPFYTNPGDGSHYGRLTGITYPAGWIDPGMGEELSNEAFDYFSGTDRLFYKTRTFANGDVYAYEYFDDADNRLYRTTQPDGEVHQRINEAYFQNLAGEWFGRIELIIFTAEKAASTGYEARTYEYAGNDPMPSVILDWATLQEALDYLESLKSKSSKATGEIVPGLLLIILPIISAIYGLFPAARAAFESHNFTMASILPDISFLGQAETFLGWIVFGLMFLTGIAVLAGHIVTPHRGPDPVSVLIDELKSSLPENPSFGQVMEAAYRIADEHGMLFDNPEASYYSFRNEFLNRAREIAPVETFDLSEDISLETKVAEGMVRVKGERWANGAPVMNFEYSEDIHTIALPNGSEIEVVNIPGRYAYEQQKKREKPSVGGRKPDETAVPGEKKLIREHDKKCRFSSLSKQMLFGVDSEGVSYDVFANINACGEGHVLLASREPLAQLLESVDQMKALLLFTRRLGPSYEGLFNSPRAAASVYHFHGQFIRFRSKIWQNLSSGKLSIKWEESYFGYPNTKGGYIEGWPARIRYLESKDPDELARAVMVDIGDMSSKDTPYNLVYRHEEGVYKVLVIPRTNENTLTLYPESDLPKVIGGTEAAGRFITFKDEDFRYLTENPRRTAENFIIAMRDEMTDADWRSPLSISAGTQPRDEDGRFGPKPGGSPEEVFEAIINSDYLLRQAKLGQLTIDDYRLFDARVSRRTNLRDFKALVEKGLLEIAGKTENGTISYQIAVIGMEKIKPEWRRAPAVPTDPAAGTKPAFGELDEFDQKYFYWDGFHWRSKIFPKLVLGSLKDIRPDPSSDHPEVDMEDHVAIRTEAGFTIYVVDNHQYSYPYTKEAQARGDVPQKGNIHLFVDRHSDDNKPSALPKTDMSLVEAERYSREALGIDDFNVVLVHDGTIAEHWHIEGPLSREEYEMLYEVAKFRRDIFAGMRMEMFSPSSDETVIYPSGNVEQKARLNGLENSGKYCFFNNYFGVNGRPEGKTVILNLDTDATSFAGIYGEFLKNLKKDGTIPSVVIISTGQGYGQTYGTVSMARKLAEDVLALFGEQKPAAKLQPKGPDGRFLQKPGGSPEDMLEVITRNRSLLKMAEQGMLSKTEYRVFDRRVSETTNERDFEKLCEEGMLRVSGAEGRIRTYAITTKGYKRALEILLRESESPVDLLRAFFESLKHKRGSAFEAIFEALVQVSSETKDNAVVSLIIEVFKSSANTKTKEAAAIILSQWCSQPARAEKARRVLSAVLGKERTGIFDRFGVWVIDLGVDDEYKFTPQDLDRIEASLGVIPDPHLKSGAIRVILRTHPEEHGEKAPAWMLESGIWSEQAKRIKTLGTYDKELRIIRINETEEMERAIFHEVGHGVYSHSLTGDQRKSFGLLHSASAKKLPENKQGCSEDVFYEDFAYPYGAVNEKEDFATIYECLVANHKMLFRKAREIAGAGQSDLLNEKLKLAAATLPPWYIFEELPFHALFFSEKSERTEEIETRITGILKAVLPSNIRTIKKLASEMAEEFEGMPSKDRAAEIFAAKIEGAGIHRGLAETIARTVVKHIREKTEKQLSRKKDQPKGPDRGPSAGGAIGLLLAALVFISGCTSDARTYAWSVVFLSLLGVMVGALVFLFFAEYVIPFLRNYLSEKWNSFLVKRYFKKLNLQRIDRVATVSKILILRNRVQDDLAKLVDKRLAELIVQDPSLLETCGGGIWEGLYFSDYLAEMISSVKDSLVLIAIIKNNRSYDVRESIHRRLSELSPEVDPDTLTALVDIVKKGNETDSDVMAASEAIALIVLCKERTSVNEETRRKSETVAGDPLILVKMRKALKKTHRSQILEAIDGKLIGLVPHIDDPGVLIDIWTEANREKPNSALASSADSRLEEISLSHPDAKSRIMELLQDKIRAAKEEQYREGMTTTGGYYEYSEVKEFYSPSRSCPPIEYYKTISEWIPESEQVNWRYREIGGFIDVFNQYLAKWASKVDEATRDRVIGANMPVSVSTAFPDEKSELMQRMKDLGLTDRQVGIAFGAAMQNMEKVFKGPYWIERAKVELIRTLKFMKERNIPIEVYLGQSLPYMLTNMKDPARALIGMQAGRILAEMGCSNCAALAYGVTAMNKETADKSLGVFAKCISGLIAETVYLEDTKELFKWYLDPREIRPLFDSIARMVVSNMADYSRAGPVPQAVEIALEGKNIDLDGISGNPVADFLKMLKENEISGIVVQGGAVNDLLHGRKPKDIDIVVKFPLTQDEIKYLENPPSLTTESLYRKAEVIVEKLVEALGVTKDDILHHRAEFKGVRIHYMGPYLAPGGEVGEAIVVNETNGELYTAVPYPSAGLLGIDHEGRIYDSYHGIFDLYTGAARIAGRGMNEFANVGLRTVFKLFQYKYANGLEIDLHSYDLAKKYVERVAQAKKKGSYPEKADDEMIAARKDEVKRLFQDISSPEKLLKELKGWGILKVAPWILEYMPEKDGSRPRSGRGKGPSSGGAITGLLLAAALFIGGCTSAAGISTLGAPLFGLLISLLYFRFAPDGIMIGPGGRGEIDELIERLKKDKTQKEAAEVLVQKGSEAVPALIDLLGSFTTKKHKAAAAEVLGRIKDTRAVQPLIELYEGEEKNVALLEAIVEALGDIGDSKAVWTLGGALRHKGLNRQKAVDALVRIGNTEAIDFLVEALHFIPGEADTAYRHRRPIVARALGNIGSSHLADSAADIAIRSKIITALSKVMKSDDHYAREAAAFSIALIGTPEAKIALVRETYPDDREKNKPGRLEAMKALIRLQEHEDAQAAGRSKSKQEKKKVPIAAKKDKPEGSSSVPTSLIREVNEACKVLEDESKDKAARNAAMVSVSSVGPQLLARINASINNKIVTTLLSLLYGRDEDLRMSAVCVLGNMGPHVSGQIDVFIKALRPLLDDRDPEIQIAAAKAIENIDPKREHQPHGMPIFFLGMSSVEKIGEQIFIFTVLNIEWILLAGVIIGAIIYLYKRYYEPAYVVPRRLRNRAEVLIGRLHRDIEAPKELRRIGKPAVPALIKALKIPGDKRWGVRFRAADILGDIGSDAKEALPDLIYATHEGAVSYYSTMEKNPTVRRAAVIAIGKIGEAEQKEFNGKEPRADDIGARRAMETETCAIHYRGIDALIKCLNDSDQTVRDAAVEALIKIGTPGMVQRVAEAYGEKLAEGLSTDPFVFCIHAALVLGEAKDPKTIEVLRRALKHDYAIVQRTAINALSKFGPAAKDAIPDIEELAKNRMLRDAATEALREMRGEGGEGHPGLSAGGAVLGLLFWAGLVYEWITGAQAGALPASYAAIFAPSLGTIFVFFGIAMAIAMLLHATSGQDVIAAEQPEEPEEEPSERAWPRFAPSVRYRHQIFKILNEMYPDEKARSFKSFITQIEEPDKISGVGTPENQRIFISTIVDEARSLLPYFFKVTDTYSLYMMQSRGENKDKLHFYMYNPRGIGSHRNTLVVVATNEGTEPLAETSVFLSRKIPEIIGRKISIRQDWHIEPVKKQKVLLFFDIVDAETDQALSQDQIDEVYAHLPENWVGVVKGTLRGPAEKAMRKVLQVDPEPKEEKVLFVNRSGRDRVAEGYAYVLPGIDSSVFDERICLDWDSKRLADLKIAATIYDLERALEALHQRHTQTTISGIFSYIFTTPLSQMLTGKYHTTRENAMQRINIVCRDIVEATMQDGKKARKIRHVLREKIDREVAQYEGMDKAMADEIRQLGDELMEEFRKNRESIAESEVGPEKEKLKRIFEQIKKDIEESFTMNSASEDDIERYFMALDDYTSQTNKLIEKENITAASALLTVIEKQEEMMEKMRDPKFRSLMRDVITHALRAVGKLQTPLSLNGFLKDQISEMEMLKLQDNIDALGRTHDEVMAKGEEPVYSAIFLQALRLHGKDKIGEGKTATKAAIEIMNEMLEANPEMSASEKSRIKATADFIIETLDAVRLLDDTHYLVRGESPIIIVTNSLDTYQAPKLLEESNQITGLVTDEGAATSHWAIWAKKRVPAMTNAHSEDGSGAKTATANIKMGDRLIIDEEAGIIYVNPGFQTEEAMDIKRAESAFLEREADERSKDPVKTKDGAKVEYAADIVDPDKFERESLRDFRDIGLLRSEVLYREKRPTKNELIKLFTGIANETDGIVTIRMFDMQPDKKPRYLSKSRLRGTGYLFEDPEGKRIAQPLAESILEAYYASDRRNIRILFPNVKDGAEAGKARAFVEALDENIRREAEKHLKEMPPAISIGGMIETTGAVDAREDIVGVFDFISVGLSDLIDSIKGYEGDRSAFAFNADLLPQELDEDLTRVYETTSKLKKELCICGEWLDHLKTVIVVMNVSKKYEGRMVITADPDRLTTLKHLTRYTDTDEVMAAVEPLRGDEEAFDKELERSASDIREQAIDEAFERRLRKEGRGSVSGRMPNHAGAALLGVIASVAGIGGMGIALAANNVLIPALIGLCAVMFIGTIVVYLKGIVAKRRAEGREAARHRLLSEMTRELENSLPKDLRDDKVMDIVGEIIRKRGVTDADLIQRFIQAAIRIVEYKFLAKSMVLRTDVSILIGVAGKPDEVIDRINKDDRIGGIEVIALSGKEEKDLAELRKKAKELGAYGMGIVDGEKLSEKEVFRAIQGMRNAIEKRDMRVFILANPDLVKLEEGDDSTIEEVLLGLKKVTSHLPVIQWVGISESSIYNLRMKKHAARITNGYVLEDKTKAYTSVAAERGVMSARADSLGELKMLAEAHRKRMNLSEKKLEESPVRLSVRLALSEEDLDKVKEAGVQHLLEEMDIADVVKEKDVQVMTKDEADNMTAKGIHADVSGRYAGVKDIVIVDKAKEARTAEEVEGIVLVEYEGLASARLYDIALDVLAHSDETSLKTIVGKVAELARKGKLWVILGSIEKVDTEELRNELDKYHHQILIMA